MYISMWYVSIIVDKKYIWFYIIWSLLFVFIDNVMVFFFDYGGFNVCGIRWGNLLIIVVSY